MTIHVPPLDPKIELEPGSERELLRDPEIGTTKLLMVRPQSLEVMEGFNIKVRGSPSYEAAVKEYADSIQTEGWYRDKPLTGFIGKNAEGKSVIFVVDGHTRLESLELIAKRAPERLPEKIPVIVKPRETNITDLTVSLFKTGKELSPYAQAIGVKRLSDLLLSSEEIAKRTGLSKRYVDELKMLMAVPPKLHKLLASEKVKATLVMQQIREKGQVGAVEDIAAASEAADKAAAEAPTPEAAKKAGRVTKATVERVAAQKKAAGTERTQRPLKDGAVKIVFKGKVGDVVPLADINAFSTLYGGDWYDLSEGQGSVKITAPIKVTIAATRKPVKPVLDTQGL